MPTVKTCCCGCTLRTGTLILLWLGAVLSGISILTTLIASAQQNIPFSSVLIHVLIRVIIIGIYVMGIYGVEKERPSFLKPFLGLQVCGMVVIIIIMAFFAFFGTAVLAYLSGTSNQRDEKVAEAAVGGILFAEIMCLLFLGLTYYFFVVVLSFYKEMKGEIPR